MMLTVQVPGLQYTPVYPICHSTSACNVCATCRGMALSNRRLECLPVACQNPEPRERLALFRGRDDCHFWLHRVSLHGTMESASGKEEHDQKPRGQAHIPCSKARSPEVMFQKLSSRQPQLWECSVAILHPNDSYNFITKGRQKKT